ncbi:hypothetical protein KW797_03960 [Candidatus Parcubacteria bacterium]|nr:hypothetical protein [Candidatus Parcubacteria bacterium]
MGADGFVNPTFIAVSTTNGSPYDIVVGTLGTSALLANISSSNVNGLKAAVQALTGSVNATTGKGSIFYRQGVYTLGGATVPAGTVLYCTEGSSTVFANTMPGSPLLTIYGEVRGCTFDLAMASNTNGVPLFDMKSGSKFTRNRVINGDRAQPGVNTFNMTSATNVVIKDNDIIGYVHGNIGNTTMAPFGVNSSSDIFIKNNYFDRATGLDSEIIGIQNSNRVYVDGNTFADARAAIVVSRGGSQEIYIENNVGTYVAAPASNGVFDFTGTNNSTPIWINNNKFAVNTNVGGTFVGLNNAIAGVVISNNSIRARTSNTVVFVTIGNVAVVNTVLMGNSTWGVATFISDSGTGTRFTGNDNWKDSIEQ